MKRSLYIIGAALFLATAVSSPALAAREYDPAIKEYMEGVKNRKKREAEAEKQAIKADPHRRLRPYQTLEEINRELDEILAAHPDILTGGTFGKSAQGRDLRYIRMNTGAPGDKAQVLVTGNIHAQELAAGQMVMALIRHFALEYGRNCHTTNLADQLDIYFIPVMNPDHMEKAALMQSEYGFTTFVRKNVNEVDLNRNFPYPADATSRLKDSAGSPKVRSMNYRGPEPLSEPETRALIEFVARHDFALAINYHTSGGLILYAPGTYPEPVPDTQLMREIAFSYQAEQFNKYEVEPSIDLYPTIGALDDYLYHRYGILAFTVEVGLEMEKRAFDLHNGSLSPVFWAYNVYDLDEEAANNVPGALAMFEWAIKVHNDPDMIKWEPEAELWVGEPARLPCPEVNSPPELSEPAPAQ